MRSFRRLNSTRPQQWFTTETSPTNLLLLEDIVTPEEEDAFISIATKILARKKYEGNHWDDVIIKYKEVDFGHHLNRLDQSLPEVVRVNSAITKVKSRIQEALNRSSMEFQSSHVIDLAPDGWIGKKYPTYQHLVVPLCVKGVVINRSLCLQRKRNS